MIVLLVLAVYFLPSMLASRRECRSTAAIVVFNVIAGWTLLGWWIALAWALAGRIRGGIWPTEVVIRVRVVERMPDAQ